MDAELGKLIYSTANTLVGAMASDGWGTVRKRFGRWLRRHRAADSASVLDKLELLCTELEWAARNESEPEAFKQRCEALRIFLATQLAEALTADPAASGELKALDAEWRALPGVAARAADSAADDDRAYAGQLVDPRIAGIGYAPAWVRGRIVSSGWPRPNMAPATTARWVDREEQLARLRAWIARTEGSARVLTLWGVGGIGKTALAAKVTELVRPSFPHGRLYADLRGSTGESPEVPVIVLGRFLRALGVAAAEIPASEEERLDLYRTLTADLALTVVLDDAGSAAQALPLICPSPHSLTVVTSRDHLDDLVIRLGAQTERITPMDAESSRSLILAIAGLEDEDETRTPPHDLDERLARCKGVPLALALEGAHMAVGDDGGGDDDETRSAAGDVSGVDLLVSYQDLPERAARLHRLLCTQAWPSITAGPAAAVAGVDEATAAELLALLFRAELLERSAASVPDVPRYRVHDSVREEATRRALAEDGVAAVMAAERAIVEWYLEFAVLADWQLRDRWHLGRLYEALDARRAEAVRAGESVVCRYASDRDALDALERELENLMECVRVADRRSFHDLAPELCEAQWSVFLQRGHPQECVMMHRIGVAGAVASGAKAMESRMRVALAFGLMWLGRLTEADEEFQRGIAAARESGHAMPLASSLESLGLLCLEREQYARAAELFEQAREVAQHTDNPKALALLDHHRGRALSGLGRFDEAQASLDRALAGLRALRTPDVYNEGRVLMSISEAALHSGRPESASVVLGEASAIMEAVRATTQQARVASLRAWSATVRRSRRGTPVPRRGARTAYACWIADGSARARKDRFPRRCRRSVGLSPALRAPCHPHSAGDGSGEHRGSVRSARDAASVVQSGE